METKKLMVVAVAAASNYLRARRSLYSRRAERIQYSMYIGKAFSGAVTDCWAAIVAHILK